MTPPNIDRVKEIQVVPLEIKTNKNWKIINVWNSSFAGFNNLNDGKTLELMTKIVHRGPDDGGEIIARERHSKLGGYP